MDTNNNRNCNNQLRFENNRYSNIDAIEWKMIDLLLNSESKYAENLWKILAYPTVDCLLKDNLTKAEKNKLIFIDEGQETSKRVFITPFVDDGWTEQCAMVRFYVDSVLPQNVGRSDIIVSVEAISHSKVGVIAGEADEDNPQSNPNDFKKDGSVLVPYKSRVTTMVKYLAALFNGMFLDGGGILQLNREINSESGIFPSLWNSKAYFGSRLKFAIKMQSTSTTPTRGF